MKRICFLCTSPFSIRDYKRFAINEIINLGYEVLVLDCTPLLEKSFEKYVNGENLCIKSKYVKRCYSLIKLIKYLLNFKPNWCVDFLEGYSKKYYFKRVFIRIFLKLISRIVIYRLGAFPYHSNLINKNFIIFFKNKIKLFIVNLLSIPWKIFREDKVVVGGYSEYKKIKDKNKLILAHNLDFDDFKKIKIKSRSVINEKYLLFLDEDFPCHSDYEREGISPNVDERIYYEEISSCLKFIGNKFHLNPIVKLHPRANFKKSKALYEPPITLEDTAQCIFNSNLIIGHCSTSIQIGVLCYKPIILIKPNELLPNTLWYLTIEKFSRVLGIPSYKSEDIFKIKSIPQINKEKYDKYIENYIKIKNSSNKFSWEIILENLFI